MKPGSAPSSPDHEDLDPLLATLHQRLGDYGAAPPPAAWAAIRRRVAPPLPWWRRGHHLLLALLAGMLLVSTPTGHRGPHWASRQPSPRLSVLAKQRVSSTKSAYLPATKRPDSHRSTSGSAFSPVSPAVATSTKDGLSFSKLAASQSSARATSASTRPPGKPALVALGTNKLTVPQRQAQDVSQESKPGPSSKLLASRSHRQAGALATRLPGKASQFLTLRAAAPPEVAALVRSHLVQNGQCATRLMPRAKRRLGTAEQFMAGSAVASTQLALPHSAHARSHPRPGQMVRQAASPARQISLPVVADSRSAQPAFITSPATERCAHLDTLAPKQASLLLPGLALLPVLVARPDSASAPLAVRRWSVLVLAGPTLSYRTLGSAPTLAAGHPNFARLERPALGLGAQVQVRRVLSGRWALAVGTGYQEYATQLALSVKDSATYHTVRQRDTYRLLTVPVQLTYALVAPRRLAASLLLGAEPGWYLGGRSTEGSGCGCEQQTYAATGSPYRSLTVAVSLGLDLHLRLGSTGSRWQWLVQPTGRYVATPFVRADAADFTRRQPFSLGLLTGFSWDVR